MKNAQGDVLQIRSKWGTTLVEYEYDAWGNCSIVYTHSAYGSFGEINPIRYRSYFYDFETGFYYLQSRYYDPAIRRFISADSYVSTGQGFIGCNMFAYCLNNPACRVEVDGYFSVTALEDRLDVFHFNRFDAMGGGAGTGTLSPINGNNLGRKALGGLFATTAALLFAKTVTEIDAEIRTKVKETSDDRYWEAYRINNIVNIGAPISYDEAVKRVKSGKSVFAVTKMEAMLVAYVAGGYIKPMKADIHGDGGVGYYYHYHIHKHGNEAHIWYLYG